MSRELDSVVLRGKCSLRSRIPSWFYPNRGWKGGSRRRKELTHAV